LLFATIGDGSNPGKFWNSPDLNTAFTLRYTSPTADPNANRFRAAYHNGRVVVVAGGGAALGTTEFNGDSVVSTDGGTNWTTYTDAIGMDTELRRITVENGQFVVVAGIPATGVDAGKYQYSADGITWSAEITPEGVTTDSTASIVYLNGFYYYMVVNAPTKVFISTNIASGFVESTLSGGDSFYTSGVFPWLYTAADLLIARLDTGLAWSRNGIDWTLFPETTVISGLAKIQSTQEGLIIPIANTNGVSIKNYTANNAPDTFSIPYPAEGEAPAPWQYYVRAFQ
jgi:hypothetical protein